MQPAVRLSLMRSRHRWLDEGRRRAVGRAWTSSNAERLHLVGTILQSSQLVLACANAATNLLPEAYLPLKRIRGQLSYLNPAQTPALNTVLCGRSYMAPARNGRLCLGATYNLRDDDTQLRDSDHQANLDHLPDFGPQWQDLNKQQGMKLILGGRVGFRCTTPDYLPMVGAVRRTQVPPTDFCCT